MNKAILIVGIVAVVGVILGAGALYISWSEVARGPSSLAAQGVTNSGGDVEAEVLSTAVNKKQTKHSESELPSDISATQELNSAQVDEVLEWKVAHGYADFHRDFGELSDADLLSLARAGEIGALHVLATRNSHKQPDKAIEYYREAAVHGSTLALVLIGELYMFHATEDGLIQNVKTEVTGAQQALAYNFAAQILGDNGVTPIQSARLIEHTILGESLLEESVTEKSCKDARTIVDDIRKTRTANGFVPFGQGNAPYSEPVEESVSVYSYCGENV